MEHLLKCGYYTDNALRVKIIAIWWQEQNVLSTTGEYGAKDFAKKYLRLEWNNIFFFFVCERERVTN